jgi:AraC-like DNA-binding protein
MSFKFQQPLIIAKKNNFKTYLNDFRLNAFEEQIKKNDNEENLSLKEIYLDIGFNSRVTFNRTFKNKFKKTPQEYISDINCKQKVD